MALESRRERADVRPARPPPMTVAVEGERRGRAEREERAERRADSTEEGESAEAREERIEERRDSREGWEREAERQRKPRSVENMEVHPIELKLQRR